MSCTCSLDSWVFVSVAEIVPSDPIEILEPADNAATTFAVSVTSALASIAFNFEWSASVNTFESEADSTNVRISLAVWSAVAPDSIPSSFDPSDATSLPSTVPPRVILL